MVERKYGINMEIFKYVNNNDQEIVSDEQQTWDVYYALTVFNDHNKKLIPIMTVSDKNQAEVLVDVLTRVYMLGQMAASNILGGHINDLNNAIYTDKVQDTNIDYITETIVNDTIEEPKDPEIII
jgi:hypothetical protein